MIKAKKDHISKHFKNLLVLLILSKEVKNLIYHQIILLNYILNFLKLLIIILTEIINNEYEDRSHYKPNQMFNKRRRKTKYTKLMKKLKVFTPHLKLALEDFLKSVEKKVRLISQKIINIQSKSSSKRPLSNSPSKANIKKKINSKENLMSQSHWPPKTADMATTGNSFRPKLKVSQGLNYF